MAVFSSRAFAGMLAVLAIAFVIASPSVEAQSLPPACSCTSIDQGIGYLLMLVALVLTYLIHPLDAFSSYNFF
ncbi:hypothetical protein JRO89_XS01G0329500 [Xanthoceras sorbifolium]|uniref:Uncharacterized protein n=1 Tax=Xanthoceras sorbifolium TaxID=99658 RepID=A0ABQ8INC8_9ROSI|nr:hypothetical protein JRO89_XS01G0329500 [Xanthoceras sorbifolium]